MKIKSGQSNDKIEMITDNKMILNTKWNKHNDKNMIK